MNTIGKSHAKDAIDARLSGVDSSAFDNDFSHEIIGAAVEVQRVLGVGLTQLAYANALAIELHEREIGFERDVAIEAIYKGQSIGAACHAHFIVEKKVLIELKSVESVTEAHRTQMMSYLRISGLSLGLLINFHTFPVVKGIHRVVRNQ